MNKLAKLEQIITKHYQSGNSAWAGNAARAILDELMEPEERAFAAARVAWAEEQSPECIYRTVIHWIRRNK